MPLQRYRLSCWTTEAPWREGNRPAPRAWTMRPVQSEEDLRGLTTLVTSCLAGSSVPPRFSSACVVADVKSQRVTAWAAWPREPTDWTSPAGVLAVTETGRPSRRRFAVAWLLVHPAARRQGVATALVLHACTFVRNRGGHELWAETLSTWPVAAAFWRDLAREVPLNSGDDGET